ncbi:MAG: cytochrome c-type biogenesis protein CcmH, partial [Proteobacteria bacterium]|nr:cytochrome c-type biogenesis protein CcmH [Pseudomonadota bacterium]
MWGQSPGKTGKINCSRKFNHYEKKVTSRSVAFLFFFFFSCQVIAEIAGFPFETETEEQRFRELSTELRCLVCQNQSLADS